MLKEAILIDGKYHADLILEKLKKNIPFRTSNLLTRQLLSDTLHREIYSLHSNDLKLK